MDILDTEISIPNYSIIRLDRIRHGGGVALYIRNCVSYNTVLYGSTGVEVIVVSLSKSNFKLCLCVFYRPPLHRLLFLIICDVLLSVQQSYFSNFVLLGDFNVNFLDSSHSFYPYL